jgi:hypothetical protein
MIESYIDVMEDDVEGRWVIETRHDGKPWEIIVEPDPVDRVVVVITAYPTDIS